MVFFYFSTTDICDLKKEKSTQNLTFIRYYLQLAPGRKQKNIYKLGKNHHEQKLRDTPLNFDFRFTFNINSKHTRRCVAV